MNKQIDETPFYQTSKKVASIYEQEEAVSKAFQISNFYSNERLNILELKQRLEQIKRSQKKPSPPQQQMQTPPSNFSTYAHEPQSNELVKYPTSKFMLEPITQDYKPNSNYSMRQKVRQRLSHHEEVTPHTIEESERYNTKTKERATIDRGQRKEQIRNANYRIMKQVHKGRDKHEIKTAIGIRQNSLEQNHSRAHSRFENGRNGQNNSESRCSDTSLRQTWQQWALQGRLLLQNAQQVVELDKHIHSLWQHYQLLTKILMGLKQGSKQEKNAIVKYVEDVCNDRFEFVKTVIDNLHRQQTPSRKAEHAFLKRLRKNVILSRLLQNLSIVYVSLDVCLNRTPDSNLVNFVGYCCSNIIFLLRLVQLAHNIKAPLTLSAASQNILAAINEFEVGSYGASMSRMGEIYIRLEHNNEIISIVQVRMCTKMDKHFQQIVNNFLKKQDIISKPFFQYSHYIYEFFAYHLASQDIVGQFSFVEMAPSPYMSLPKQKTLVIEPWEVLFANKGTTTYIRAHTEALLKEVAKYWNIVYWTDMMPDKIDDLHQQLPPGPILYRYHCRYENGNFLKLLWRIGCDVDNTIIVDRSETNFKYDKDMGIQLPWKGQKKDIKLVEFFNAIHPLLINTNTSLKKTFPPIRTQIVNFSTNKWIQRRNIEISPFGDDEIAPFSRKQPLAKGNQPQNYQY